MFTGLPYEPFIGEFASLIQKWKSYTAPLDSPLQSMRRELPIYAPKVLLFSTHPDDESLTGVLPLRLLKESGYDIINVIVTLGSKKDRQDQRYREVQNACDFLGFKYILAGGDSGFENINLHTRTEDPQIWEEFVATISHIIVQNQPSIIFIPHENDFHPTHIGTHFLVTDALGELEKSDHALNCFIIETEYWATMSKPNLLVEASPEDVTDLITALSYHYGEIIRNPYHLSFPALLLDNVRRGAEVVKVPGSKSPDFLFAMLYRVTRFMNGELDDIYEIGKIISIYDNISDLFSVELNQPLVTV